MNNKIDKKKLEQIVRKNVVLKEVLSSAPMGTVIIEAGGLVPAIMEWHEEALSSQRQELVEKVKEGVFIMRKNIVDDKEEKDLVEMIAEYKRPVDAWNHGLSHAADIVEVCLAELTQEGDTGADN